MALTEQQRRFIERHVFKDGLSASALDLAVDTETSRTLDARARAIIDAVTARPAPPQALPAERDAMRAVSERIRDAVRPPLLLASVAAAERDLVELKGLLADVLARIKADEEEAKALAARQAERLLLIEEIDGLAAAGADELEAAAIEALKSKARQALPESPSEQDLAEARAPMKALRDGVALTVETVAARAVRRDEIVALRDAALPAGLLATERSAIATSVLEFPALAGAISAATLGLAETALVKLAKLKSDAGLAKAARQVQAARVATALSQAAWGSGTLAAPAGAPAALVKAEKDKLAALQSDNAAFAQPDAPDEWPLKETKAIADRADAVIAGLAGVRDALQAIQAAVDKVALAEAATRSQIAATATHALSASQQAALTDRIAAAKALFSTQLSEADGAVAALAAITTAAKTLQRELRALAQRVAAVDIVPAGASAADRKVLADLRKAAVEAIEKVEP